jgi:hypothetical protein
VARENRIGYSRTHKDQSLTSRVPVAEAAPGIELGWQLKWHTLNRDHFVQVDQLYIQGVLGTKQPDISAR